MDFALSTEQLDLAGAERAWLAKHDPILHRRADIDDGPARIPADARKHIVESGLAGLLTEAAGGTNVDLLVLTEEHGRAGSAVPLAEIAVAAAILERVGHPAAVAASAGEVIVIPVASAGTLAVRVAGDTLHISGTTSPATGLVDADHILLLAETDDGREVAAVIGAGDVTVSPADTLDLLRSWAKVEVDLTLGVWQWSFLPAGTTRAVCEQIAVFRAVDALGCADRLLAMTVGYAGQRTQFGSAIGSFQAVKHHLANMAVAVEASRATLWAAALALDEKEGPERTRAVSSAVAFACRNASDVGQLALQVHGGIGFTWEHDVHLLIRRIKVDELLDGSVREHRRRLVSATTVNH